jgi:hypothetical protein
MSHCSVVRCPALKPGCEVHAATALAVWMRRVPVTGLACPGVAQLMRTSSGVEILRKHGGVNKANPSLVLVFPVIVSHVAGEVALLRTAVGDLYTGCVLAQKGVQG